MRKQSAKILSILLTLSLLIGYLPVTTVFAGAVYNQPLNSDIFAGASESAKEQNPWEYKTYQYGRREGTYNVPILTVTYTGDNQVTVKARYNPKGENWGGRPFIGITVPKGFNRPTHIIRREFYDKFPVSNTKISVSNWRTSSRVIDLGGMGKEWNSRVRTTWGYDGDEGALNRHFKDVSDSLFLSWEKSGASIYELEYTTTVRDFTAKNNILASFSQVLNRYSRHAGIYAANPKPVPPPPPAPKMSETYDLKRPALLPVADPANALTSEEQNQVIQKIKEVNPGLENIAAVSYDAGAKTFKVVFNKDQSEIVVPQKDLVYKKPAPKLDPLNLPFKLGEKVMLPNEDAYNQLGNGRSASFSAKTEVLARFLRANGNNGVKIAENSTASTGHGYGSGLNGWEYTLYFPSGGYTPDISGSGMAVVKGSDNAYYYLGDNAVTRTGMKVYKTEHEPGGYPEHLVDTTTVIPFSRLFTYPNDPNNSDPNAITPDDKNDIRDAINRILDPNKFLGIDGVDTARDNLLNQVDGKNTRDELNALLTEANNKASEFALALANKKLDLDKEHAKKIINGLTELNPTRKQELLNNVDGLSVTSDKSYTAAKAELDGFVTTALNEDLDTAKQTANTFVDDLENPIQDGGATDVFKPDEVKQALNQIPSTGLNTNTHATGLAEIKKLKEKAKIDSEREAVLKKLADSNLPNKEELKNQILANNPDGTGGPADTTALEKVDEAKKALEKAKADTKKDDAKNQIDQLLPNDPNKANELKNKIDNATSTDEIDSILEEAKVHNQKTDALAKIENLTHLNQAQKNAYKNYINGVQNEEELEAYLDDARELDNSMASLIAEYNKSKAIKDGNQAPYNTASNATKQPFDAALTETKPIVNLQNAEDTANLNNYAVSALLDKLQKARLALVPDGQDKTEAEVVKQFAEELKAELREKNKQTKEEVKTIKDDYTGFDALGDKDTPDEVGTIITEAEEKINEELAKLDDQSATAEEVRDAIETIKNETLIALEKEKLKAALEKLNQNIQSEPDQADKTEESIQAYEASKASAEQIHTNTENEQNNPNLTTQDIGRLIASVLDADRDLTEKENSLQDNANIDGLNKKIAELEALTQKARPTKFVTDNTKQAATTKISEANTTLGNAQDPSTARGLAAKPKPTKEEVDRMIETLTEKINALNTALEAERTESKNKVDAIVNALFTENSATNEATNKATYLTEAAKLTSATETQGDAVTNPDAFIETLLTNASNAAVDGYAHLNDAQKTPAKADLLAKAKAVTANGNVDALTTAVSTLDTLNTKMDAVAKLKAKGDKVKEQVKYLKESTQDHKTAFDTAVDNLTVTTNKTADELDTLMSAYNTALGNLDGKATAPQSANRVTVANPKQLTQDEKNQILDAVIAANNTITDKIDRANSSVSDTGVVTLAYNDAATSTLNEAVDKTPNSTLSASEVLVPAFSAPVKTLVSLGPDGNLTQDDKNKVKEAVLKANKTLSESQPPQLTADHITVDDDGTVHVTLPGGENKTLSANETVDKTTKPNALNAVSTKKTEVENALNGMGLEPAVLEALKEELTNAQNTANGAISGAQSVPDTNDHNTAYTTATTAVADAVTAAQLTMDKVKAKAELEKQAKAQKDAIDGLSGLSTEKRTELKNQIDAALNEAKQNVDQAQDTNGVGTAKDAGLLAIDKIKAKADIENKGEEIKNAINQMNGLTEEEKREASAAIDNLVQSESGKVDTATSATLADVVTAAKEALDNKKQESDSQNLESMKVLIATLDSLLEQNAPTKYVTDEHKEAVQTAKTQATETLGDQNNPTSAKGIAAKQNPTQDEINAMINTLNDKITALTNALTDAKTDAKNKLDEIVGALFPQKAGAEDPNKQTYLEKVAKLTADLGQDDPDRNTVLTTPDDYISTLLTEATAAAVDGYTNLNDAQKAAHKTDLLEKANAVTADGTVATLTTAVTGLQTLDGKMAEVAKLKAKGDKVKEQVKYLKESTESEKTAFDDAVTALTFADNKDENAVDTLISHYNTALGNLDGKATAPSAENRVSVANPKQVTEDEKGQILDAIIAANPEIANKIDKNASSVTDEGVVTLVYNDGATVGAETLTATPSTTLTAAEVLKANFNKPAKVLVSLGQDGQLTPADKEKVKEAILKANKTLSESNPPQLTKENITVNNDGSVSIVLPGRNQTETVSADEAVDKTTKPTALTGVGNKKTEVENAIDGMGLDPEVAQRLKDELGRSKLKAESAITDAQTDLEADNKEEAYTAATTAVTTAVSTAELKMDKIKAKAELEKTAKEHKAAIDALRPLDEATRNAWKQKVDEALEAAKEAVDGANSLANVNTAKANGITNMDKEKAKAELANQAESIKAQIDEMTGLTSEQKDQAKQEVDTVLATETEKVSNAPVDQLETVTASAKSALNAELEKAESKNLETLNAKIEELDALTKQVRPTKYVNDDHKNQTDRLITEANNTLGEEANPAPTSARGIANKQPKPTAEEVNAMVTDLNGKIEALTNALNAEKTDAKTKLEELVTALFPDKNGAPDPNKQTYLEKVAKLTNVQDGDPDKDTVTNTPDAYIATLITDATAAAVDGYTHLNDAQKAAHKESLKTAANALTANDNVDSITTAINGLQALDAKMDEVEKLKEKGDKVKEQVKYIKEGTEAEKTAFDAAVTALTDVTTAATGENKDVNALDALINDYNTALGNLNGEAVKPNPNDRVIVVNPNQLTAEEKTKILDKIIAANRDIEAKIDRDNSVVSDSGEVTLVYKDGATTTAGETVDKTPNTTFAPNDVLIPQFTAPAKVLVSLNENGQLTEADKDKVKDAVLAANPDLANAQPPLLTKDNIDVADDGTITVTFDNNYSETVTADNAVDKTTKPTAVTALTEYKDGVAELVDSLNLDETTANRLKEELETALTHAKNEIAAVNTDLTHDDKEAAYNAAVEKVEPLVEKAKLAMEKIKAKAALEKQAQAHKAAIDALRPLDEATRNELKAAIDEALNRAKEAVDQANDEAEITAAKDAGILEINKVKAKADVANKGAEVKAHIDNLPNLTDDQKIAAKAEVDQDVNDANTAITNSATNGTPEENATALENAVNSSNAELDKDKAKADLTDKGEEIKKHIDNLPNLTDKQKEDAKAEVDADVNTGTTAIENVATNGTPEENATALENAVNSSNAELDKDKAKADLTDKGEEIKKQIDNLPNLTDKQKEDAKAEVDADVNTGTTAIENVATNGTPEENATALENAVNSANAELDQDKAKADLLNKGEELKDYIDHMKHLSKEQKEKAKEAIDQDVAAGIEAIENLPTNGTPEANATALENTVNIANAELDKEKAKAELLNEAEKIKDYVNILPTLNDDQKKDFKDQVDKVVAAETAALDAIVPTGDADADREAIQSEKDRADGLLKEIKDNVIETAKPILLGGEEEEYNPWVKLVFDQEKETEKDRVPNTGAHR